MNLELVNSLVSIEWRNKNFTQSDFLFLECNYTVQQCITLTQDISASETELPRPVRTALAQLCSSYCRQLNSDKAVIFPGMLDLCPECGVAPHTVAHLFDCVKHPTELTVRDLWDQPAETADFTYFILPTPTVMIQDDMLGYNNNNNLACIELRLASKNWAVTSDLYLWLSSLSVQFLLDFLFDSFSCDTIAQP